MYSSEKKLIIVVFCRIFEKIVLPHTPILMKYMTIYRSVRPCL